MNCSPPGSSVHEILQARILEWVAISFSKESSQPRDWTRVACIAGRFFMVWATREAPGFLEVQNALQLEAMYPSNPISPGLCSLSPPQFLPHLRNSVSFSNTKLFHYVGLPIHSSLCFSNANPPPLPSWGQTHSLRNPSQRFYSWILYQNGLHEWAATL